MKGISSTGKARAVTRGNWASGTFSSTGKFLRTATKWL
jgi:hypothetical protein